MNTVNFGGFIPLSTVDWHGRASCVVFFRGCNIWCPWCHNPGITSGEDYREVESIFAMIKEAQIAASSLVLTGGEPTCQDRALIQLATLVKNKLEMESCLYTNGTLPYTLARILSNPILHKISLDIKTQWGINHNYVNFNLAEQQSASFAVCNRAHMQGILPEFDVTLTMFPGMTAMDVPGWIPSGQPLVLQQGNLPNRPSLTHEELVYIAENLDQPIRIRTRERGEVQV